MSKGERRLEYILEQLKKGTPSTEINDEIDRRKEAGEAGLLRGGESEKRAASIIGTVGIVEKVKHIKKDSIKDGQQKDLEVIFSQNEMRKLLGQEPSIGYVWVQVKSNRGKVFDFKGRYGKTKEEIIENLARDRLVVLNGRSNADHLIRSFTKQVKDINGCWYEIKKSNK